MKELNLRTPSAFIRGSMSVCLLLSFSLYADEIEEVLFSSEAPLHERLCSYIQQEKEAIWIATYHFTDAKVAEELIAAHKRGVSVEIITHKNTFSKALKDLQSKGIVVKTYQPPSKRSLMHHKFVLFKKNSTLTPLVWTGSSNITYSGSKVNRENSIVISGQKTFEAFKREFDSIPK